MTRRLSHDAVEELLGAYALDAVEPDEAEAIELHLRDCPRCRATVNEFRETAAVLATGHHPAPVEVWDGIVAGLEGAAASRSDRVPTWMRPRVRRGWGLLAAAAAVLLVVGLGAQTVNQNRRIDRMQSALESRSIASAALAAQGDAHARRAEMRTADGKVLARAVLLPDGTGFMWSAGLPRLARDRTYQLWAVIGTERISAGVLGAEPEVVPFKVAGEVIGLAITEESAGGVVASTNSPVVSGLVAT